MRLDDMPDDGQAEAQTTVSPGAARFGLLEALEDMRQEPWLDP
jgi:hypothetical protein